MDSFAWFEYFAGSPVGMRVSQMIRSNPDVATPASCLAELKRKRIRQGRSWQKEIDFIRSKSQVISLSESIALAAGEIIQLHFADALVYATALELGGTLLTGDAHFKGLPHVEFLDAK